MLSVLTHLLLQALLVFPGPETTVFKWPYLLDPRQSRPL